jgi:hypothetical protein
MQLLSTPLLAGPTSNSPAPLRGALSLAEQIEVRVRVLAVAVAMSLLPAHQPFCGLNWRDWVHTGTTLLWIRAVEIGPKYRESNAPG